MPHGGLHVAPCPLVELAAPPGLLAAGAGSSMREQGRVPSDDELRDQLERAYDELAGWRAREPDGQTTAQALHEAEQRVAALLDERQQLREQNEYLDEGLRHAAEECNRFMAERDEMRRLGREAEMERDTLAHANELLRQELAEAREAAEHLWFSGEEHGISDAEAREWYPWLYELHEQKLTARRTAAMPPASVPPVDPRKFKQRLEERMRERGQTSYVEWDETTQQVVVHHLDGAKNEEDQP